MTEMMTCDWSMIIVYVLCVVKLLYAVMLFVYSSNLFRRVYFRCQKFLFPAHTESPKTDAGKWSRFMAPIFQEHVSRWPMGLTSTGCDGL